MSRRLPDGRAPFRRADQGGGKTEAYLALTAFTICLGRLRDAPAGVVVLMRYTLRLLTAQQFQRASSLILALEHIRRTRYMDADLGQEEISIGLWVGEGLSPNRRADAKRSLDKLGPRLPRDERHDFDTDARDSGDYGGVFGLLLYTASGDSEGTLGGLVRQGEPERLEGTVRSAVRNAMICSSDPLCIESGGQGLFSLNLSACHACTLLPETSCEESNLLLDRALVVGTPDDPNWGFMSGFLALG